MYTQLHSIAFIFHNQRYFIPLGVITPSLGVITPSMGVITHLQDFVAGRTSDKILLGDVV